MDCKTRKNAHSFSAVLKLTMFLSSCEILNSGLTHMRNLDLRNQMRNQMKNMICYSDQVCLPLFFIKSTEEERVLIISIRKIIHKPSNVRLEYCK